MTNGNDRLDRIEKLIEETAQDRVEVWKVLRETAARQNETAARQQEMAARQQEMVARQQEMVARQQEMAVRQQEMVARQQYHDEAFDRQDTAIRELKAALQIDAENIRALARIAEAHERRLDDLDGG